MIIITETWFSCILTVQLDLGASEQDCQADRERESRNN